MNVMSLFLASEFTKDPVTVPGPKMSGRHPLLEELLEICRRRDILPSKAYLTFQVYLELCEVMKLWSVEHHFDEELNLFYLSAKKGKLVEDKEIYLPVMISEDVSLQDLEKVQYHLCPYSKSLNLAIKDGDSSTTIYKITEGLVSPDSIDLTNKKKEEESKRSYLDSYIHRKRKQLYTEALKRTS